MLGDAPAHQLSDQCHDPGDDHRGSKDDEAGDGRDAESVSGDDRGGQRPPRHRLRPRHAARHQGGDDGSVTGQLADLERAHGVAAHPGGSDLVDEEALQVPGAEEAPVGLTA
jgi:hypothetical protein